MATMRCYYGEEIGECRAELMELGCKSLQIDIQSDELDLANLKVSDGLLTVNQSVAPGSDFDPLTTSIILAVASHADSFEIPMITLGMTFQSASELLILLGGCASKGTLSERFGSFEPAVRIHAIVEVTRAKNQQFVPMLVNCLSDDDSAVRTYAILGLEKLTGERFGYSYSASSSERVEALARWQDYVLVHFPPEQTDPAASQQASSTSNVGTESSRAEGSSQ